MTQFWRAKSIGSISKGPWTRSPKSEPYGLGWQIMHYIWCPLGHILHPRKRCLKSVWNQPTKSFYVLWNGQAFLSMLGKA
jgi:hypothetical protein